ncbi:MAG: hypothetical protein IT384_29170 [Deltaproteobacteria bacterium]|nr:hypothetical protein [Deltaproteobacteria bacterium]
MNIAFDEVDLSVYLFLIHRAIRGEPIHYQGACDACGLNLNMTLAQHRKKLAMILGKIARFEHSQKRPLLPALVVNKSGYNEGSPGLGFFIIAENLGLYDEDTDPKVFAREEQKKVFAFWRQFPSAFSPGPIADQVNVELARDAVDQPGALVRSRRYWAGGHRWGAESKLDEFLGHNHWRIGWGKDDAEEAAKKTWARFAEVKSGDRFAIKGYGGTHDLKIHFVGEVTAVDLEQGLLQLTRLNVPMYEGKAPRGSGAENWQDTLVPITRPDIIQMIFG